MFLESFIFLNKIKNWGNVQVNRFVNNHRNKSKFLRDQVVKYLEKNKT